MAKKIDPRLPLPPIEGYEYEDKSGEIVAQSESDISLDMPPVTSAGLQPPGSVTVVEQIFRKDPTGKVVVDLVIEVEDVPGAESYEVRTSIV